MKNVKILPCRGCGKEPKVITVVDNVLYKVVHHCGISPIYEHGTLEELQKRWKSINCEASNDLEE